EGSAAAVDIGGVSGGLGSIGRSADEHSLRGGPGATVHAHFRPTAPPQEPTNPTPSQQTSVLERFLPYVKLDTASDPASTTTPSTAKQLVLLDLLVSELKALGLNDARRDEAGIVMATLPANTSKPSVPVIGFLAHVDTSPELSGANVKPIVHRDYD